MLAVLAGSLEICVLLIRHRAKINLVDNVSDAYLFGYLLVV